MNITFSASPVESISKSGGMLIRVMETVESHTFENVKNKAELDEHFKTFKRVVTEKGVPASISIFRDRRDRSRAFAGWNKLRKSGYYVNLDKAKGYAEFKAARDAGAPGMGGV